jgi:hypothetical protein
MRKAILTAAGVALAGAVTAGGARASGPSGVEIGLRTGYALPLGDVGGSPSRALGDVVTGMVPIWIDAGYRMSPNMYLGANFQYGVGFINSSKLGGCSVSGVSCTSSDVMLGLDFHYHLMPGQTIDPWG